MLRRWSPVDGTVLIVYWQLVTQTPYYNCLGLLQAPHPFAHVEAGVRSFDMTMPEEINRRVADSIATICLAPTERALANLELEGRALIPSGGDNISGSLPSASNTCGASSAFSNESLAARPIRCAHSAS